MHHMTMTLPCYLPHVAIPLGLFLSAHPPLSLRIRSGSQGRDPYHIPPTHNSTHPTPPLLQDFALSSSNSSAISSGPVGQSASTLKGLRLLQGLGIAMNFRLVSPSKAPETGSAERPMATEVWEEHRCSLDPYPLRLCVCGFNPQ